MKDIFGSMVSYPTYQVRQGARSASRHRLKLVRQRRNGVKPARDVDISFGAEHVILIEAKLSDHCFDGCLSKKDDQRSSRLRSG